MNYIKYIKMAMAGCFVAVCLGLIYRLQLPYIFVLAVAGSFVSYKIKGQWVQKKEYDRNFFECSDYMQQMMYSYEKSKEVQLALQESSELFPAGKMKDALDDALAYLDMTYTGNSKRTALHIIEEQYPSPFMGLLHNYMLDAEEIGGEVGEAMDILKEEHQRWNMRTLLYREQCRGQQRNILAAILAAMVLCVSMLYLIPNGNMLTKYPLYQMGTTFVCVVFMVLGWFCIKLTGRNWIEEKQSYSDEEMEKKLLKYLNQEQKFGRGTLRKILKKEITRTFPQWILKLSLRLQHQDVVGAIEDSKHDAPVVLNYYVSKLAEEIHDNPGQAKPFLDFLEEFKSTESVTAMKMLYAIASGGAGNEGGQLMHLLQRIQVMEDQSAKITHENAVAWMYALFLTPMLLASVKLMLDMSMLLVSFMAGMKL
ncbi:MAG: hypothetical protein K6A30_01900 [Lachnospiraceae bacterium]|nr:hypothetical protein [Lachnospiraceae bacterium]